MAEPSAAAVEAAVAEAGPLLPLRDAEQLDLLRDDRGQVARQLVPTAPRGRGRPPGARNKRTEAVRAYLLSRYVHPLEVLAQIYSRPVDVLAAELECSKAEAMALIKSAAAEAAPYHEGKMPVAVDLSVRGDFTLAIQGLNATAGEIEELQSLSFQAGEIVEAEFEEDQALSAGDAGASE